MNGARVGRAPTFLKMVGGGPGWDNASYLDGLGGSDGDQQDAEKSYQQFKETRQAFLKRQEERMNSEAGRKFLQQQQQGVPQEEMDKDNSSSFEECGGIREPSKFHRMMQQAGRGQRPPGLEWMRGPPGMFQKLAIPLDDDDDEGHSESQE